MKDTLSTGQRQYVERVLDRINKAQVMTFEGLFYDEREECADLIRMFKHLSKYKRFADADAEKLLRVFNQQVTFKMQARVKDGRLHVQPEPVCDTPYAEAAMTLLWFSQRQIKTRVVCCKRCSKFFLLELVGRKRPREFCEDHSRSSYFEKYKARRQAAKRG